ncbi:DUF222 domain-containing protein [Agrococcus sp. TSP3-2-1]|uniref:HNH endonuclease signature motif containing protein n=1 Tax=Agrococcus sp. TSP3-2-1 TaxID=2804583 RepID=UPI003CF7F7F9
MHEGTEHEEGIFDAAALTAAGVDARAVIALIRAGAVLDPLGRSGEELALELRERDAEARGFRVMRASFGLVRSGKLVAMLAWELSHVDEPLPPELARLAADDEFAHRMRTIELRSARIEGERRALMARHVQRALDGPGDTAMAVRELASIAAVALGLSRRSVEARMQEAWQVVTELPAAHESAAAGRMTLAHLRAIEGETRGLRASGDTPEGDRRRVERELVALAETTSPGRLRARSKRIVDSALTEPLQQRYDRAREQRSVRFVDVGDGMGDLIARLPVVRGMAMVDRLAQAARSKPKDDPRTFDQFCADALCEVVMGGVVPDGVHGLDNLTGNVSVLIPATTLIAAGGPGDGPALDPAALRFPAALDGRVLVDPETARRLALGATMWERLFTDPVSGVAVTVDSRRPSAEQLRWLRARDGGCRTPGCACSGRRADLDHTIAWAQGGQTSIDNLATLCRSDHMLKHASRWSMRQLDHGVIEWTSPLGEVIVDEPRPIGPTFAELEPALPPPAGPPSRHPWADRPPPDPELLRMMSGKVPLDEWMAYFLTPVGGDDPPPPPEPWPGDQPPAPF